MYKPLLCMHPFFDHYCKVAPDAMRQICHYALKTISLSEEDMLFTAGTRCEQMIFVLEGQLVYHDAGHNAENRNPQYLTAGDWCCEACLWAEWVHHGTMHAVANTKLMALDAAEFISVTMRHQMVIRKTSLYAERFVKALNADSTDSDDLMRPREEIEEACTQPFS